MRYKNTQVSAAFVLCKLTDDYGSMPIIISSVQDEDVFTRRSAVIALGRIGPVGAWSVPKLLDVLSNDEDSLARQMAAEALGRIGVNGDSVIRTLVWAYVKDKDISVRLDADEAIRLLKP